MGKDDLWWFLPLAHLWWGTARLHRSMPGTKYAGDIDWYIDIDSDDHNHDGLFFFFLMLCMYVCKCVYMYICIYTDAKHTYTDSICMYIIYI